MNMRKAKIVCTIGPASSSPALLDRLIENGMDAAVAVIQDLQGPRIRVGLVPKGGIEVTSGQMVRLRTAVQSGEQPVVVLGGLCVPPFTIHR